MWLAYPVIAVVVGFVLLIGGADRFVTGAAATARNLGVSPVLIGLTIVGFGTSAPELLVSGLAAAEGRPLLGVGNAFGSNIANIGMVLGIAALVRPMQIHSQITRRELPALMLTVLVASALVIDLELGVWDGVLLLAGLSLMMLWVVREGLRQRADGRQDALAADFEDEMPDQMSTARAVAWLLLGLLVLVGSSHMLVWGAAEIAQLMGVSELVIGLTVVAIGTSLPELAASVAAALKNEHELAVGNIVGSNMFNTLGVFGLPALIAPGPVTEALLLRDAPVMLGFTAALLLLALWRRGEAQQGQIGRVAGVLLLGSWVTYMVYLGWTRSAAEVALAGGTL